MLLLRLAGAVARHPSVWSTALRQWQRTVPGDWWRRRPFLPVPPAEYLRFRLLTQYGDNGHPPAPGDVLNYLRWCRQQ